MARGVSDGEAAIVAAALGLVALLLKTADKGHGVWVKITWLGIPIGWGAR